jgi:NitT/TauT family transport system permease protein
MRGRGSGLARMAAGLAGFAVCWELLAWSGVVPANLFPPLGQVLHGFVALAASGELANAVLHSAVRAIEGLAIAVVLALVFGLAAALSPLLGRTLAPFVDICRTLPPPALVPLLIFALGLNQRMFMVVIVSSAVWPIYLAAVAGLGQAEPLQLATARSYGASRLWLIARVRLPSAMPAIFGGVRVGLGLCLMATIASEMIAGANGLGFLLFDTAFSLRIPEMYATLLAAGLTGLALNLLLLALQRPAIFWHVRSTASVPA